MGRSFFSKARDSRKIWRLLRECRSLYIENDGLTRKASTVPLARNFPITRACETSDGASLARNELHASLPLATDAPIISAFLLVCSRVNRESLAKYKFLKRYDAEKKLHCMKLQLIVV